MHCYVAISVFNQSRPGQRTNSLRVIETDAAYRNPRSRSIPSGKLPRKSPEITREREFICFGNYQLKYRRKLIKSQDYE